MLTVLRMVAIWRTSETGQALQTVAGGSGRGRIQFNSIRSVALSARCAPGCGLPSARKTCAESEVDVNDASNCSSVLEPEADYARGVCRAHLLLSSLRIDAYHVTCVDRRVRRDRAMLNMCLDTLEEAPRSSSGGKPGREGEILPSLSSLLLR